jgi:hypothetical protein
MNSIAPMQQVLHVRDLSLPTLNQLKLSSYLIALYWVVLIGLFYTMKLETLKSWMLFITIMDKLGRAQHYAGLFRAIGIPVVSQKNGHISIGSSIGGIGSNRVFILVLVAAYVVNKIQGYFYDR